MPVSFIPFELERWQSLHENEVPYNLADSGVLPVTLRELVGEADVERLLATKIHYPPVRGTPRLLELIAALYSGANADNVLVGVGAAEANAITIATLAGPGDHVVVMEPGYRQIRGIAQNLGCRVDAFHLRRDEGWRPDLDQLAAVVTPATRAIAVTNPNNPAGGIFTEAEMNRIVQIAERCGAWLIVDEVYRGSERLTDAETPSFWGRYDRVVAVGSMSKSYGLSGLRLGWTVAPADLVGELWRRHEYATIATAVLSMTLAEIALAEPMRTRLLQRTRTLIRDGYARIERWIDDSNGLLSIVPPEATALAFVRYHLDVPSGQLAEELRVHDGVLVAPGSYFGEEHHLRITHGLAAETLEEALRRIGTTLRRLSS